MSATTTVYVEISSMNNNKKKTKLDKSFQAQGDHPKKASSFAYFFTSISC